MKKILGRLLWFPLGLAVVWFLVANRQPVAISLDALSIDNPAIASPPLPLWLWLIASLLVGFFLGAFGMWASARPARRKARAEARELKNLRAEAAARGAPPADPVPTIEAH
ncbi:MAG: lipopolysaccharide assembly protein LapA domain-containing protein [Parvularculaceae bacterium]